MNIRQLSFSIIFSALFVAALSSCSTDTVVSDAQRKANEDALYLEFLSQKYDYYVNTLNIPEPGFRKDTVDLVYWETKAGIGSNITSGQVVGYRYKLYSLELDSLGIKVNTVLQTDSYTSSFPTLLQVDASTSTNGYVTTPGLYRAMKLMKNGGKANILMPSSLGDFDVTGYSSSYYEVEIVYVSRPQ